MFIEAVKAHRDGVPPKLAAEIRAFTLAHIRARAIPALLVTHDPEDAAAASGPVLSLNGAA